MNRRNFLKGLFATVSAPALRLPNVTLVYETFEECNAHLIWSALCQQIKRSLLDEIEAMKFTKIIGD